ncbi:ras guanine nucleotide exchange factor domain-containing protein [Fimicolochytrium jonesii]|uniref:ras guanine nucleotide exchange factor domain-containing protein n=1 Tax=Fimicolochytrium jonesii TaxID=1396493 RepID=UPI0022FE87B5|nr:ras guanine nucleotide exchange factor domain-containing protein [Fimicolochytrium jonesii]KAI8816677.1 ras guanine nucleotide exchange factor domain-containing protein [Fimicolochytrium jonesii]
MTLRRPKVARSSTIDDFSAFRVAIADDNAVVSKIMAKCLRRVHGVTVNDDDIYPDGLSLMKGLTYKRYDMILIDIQMPIINGILATKLIREPPPKSESNGPPGAFGRRDSGGALHRPSSGDLYRAISGTLPSAESGSRSGLKSGSNSAVDEADGATKPDISGLLPEIKAFYSLPRRRASVGGSAPISLTLKPKRRLRAASVNASGDMLAAGAQDEPPDQVAARILGDNKLIPIVAISDTVAVALADIYKAAGINEVLPKPATPDMLKSILAKYLLPYQEDAKAESHSWSKIPKISVQESVDSGTDLREHGEDGNLARITRNGQYIAATKDALFEAALSGTASDSFWRVFLLTYRKFASPTELSAWVFEHLKAASSEGAGQRWLNNGPLQSSKYVVAVEFLRTWIRTHWHDFEPLEMRTSLEAAIDQLGQRFPAEAEQMLQLMKKQSNKHAVRSEQIARMMVAAQEPRSLEESRIKEDIDPEILAQQLCLYNSTLFRMIDPIDYTAQIWGKASLNLTFFIERFDKESFWVATEIVNKPNLKTRTAVLSIFLKVAKGCYDAQNYFSLFAIMFGLNLSPVQRLKKTWEGLSDARRKALADLQSVTDVSKNFKSYRTKLIDADPPLVPFLPLFIKDLTFINDGNETIIKDTQMINFQKMQLIEKCITDIVSLGRIDYKWFDLEDEIQEYLANPPLETSMANLQAMSLACEPRQAT